MSTALRYNEYYNMQETFDRLYDRSLKKSTDNLNLYKIITSKQNILLAYRNVKSNKGSNTKGTDNRNIEYYKNLKETELINLIRDTLDNYKPESIRRVYIPKKNGQQRPLGIPSILDRIIQQMFKQVLEPICEARFYNHSYGFRPNRATHHAIARCKRLININKLHYVIDIDIKGFFDNVNHSKLLKQMYNIGIRDRRILTIVNKMLKTPIKGIGVPTKGTPQGGILSPLLSNIVLNELDWWISNQWENLNTKHNYTKNRIINGKMTKDISHKLRALRTTNLKEMHIVRYADDFKIFTTDYDTAKRIYYAVKNFLENNLKLQISPEKSKITNLRKKSSEFLGLKIKAKRKKNRYVASSHISDLNKENIKKNIKKLIRDIQYNSNPPTINKFNIYIMGVKNYFQYATNISLDFAEISYQTLKTLYNRLKRRGVYEVPKNPNKTYLNHHKNRYRTFKISGLYLHSIADIRTKTAVCFSQDICNYTDKGRQKIFKSINYEVKNELAKMQHYVYYNNSVELADNKLSKYSAQRGKCNITGDFMLANEVEIHHILPSFLGGTDEYENLVALKSEAHKLIHSNRTETIDKYRKLLKLNDKQIRKINLYRRKCNLNNIN